MFRLGSRLRLKSTNALTEGQPDGLTETETLDVVHGVIRELIRHFMQSRLDHPLEQGRDMRPQNPAFKFALFMRDMLTRISCANNPNEVVVYLNALRCSFRNLF